MKTAFRLFFVLLLIVSVSAPVAEAAKKKKKKDQEAEAPPGVTVEQWLVLGPVVDPLPAFHDDKTGGFDIEARLGAQVFPKGPLAPREGDVESWFSGVELAWTARQANEDGVVELTIPDASGEDRPAAAWLAAYVRTDRFRSVKLEVRGQHARRAWLDGEQVASGQSGDVKGDVKLRTSNHLLLVETLWDPSNEDDWTVGAAFVEESDEDDGEENDARAQESPALQLTLSLNPERGVTIKDILDPPSIGSVSLSPDGLEVAASLGRYLPGTDDRESWIEVRSTRDGSLLRTWRGSFEMSRVAWAPTGRRLSYVTTQKDDDGSKSTLWIADLEANTVAPLLEGVSRFSGYQWSPDGKAIAYTTSVEPEKDELGIKRLEGLFDRWATYRTKSYLNLVIVPDGVRRRLSAGPLTTGGAAFSPDGKRLLFTRSVEDYDARPFSRTELWELDLGSFEARLLREFQWADGASYSPDGELLLIRAGAAEFDGAGLDIPEGTISNNYDGQLFVWNPLTDQVDAITRDFDPAVRSARWSRADGNIYLTAEDRDYVRLYRYDVQRKTFTAIDTGFDTFGSLTLAHDAPVAVGTGTSPWTPQGLVAVHLGSGGRRILDRPGEQWFSSVRVGTVEPWSFIASGGKTIDGRIYLPPGFDPSRKYPLIVYYYGGTSPTTRDFGGRYPKEYWAANGYVVYTLQPSGATGFGQAFSAVHVNDWGKTTSEEIIEGTRRFLEAHPYADPEGAGCIGASYGGFMTMLLSTKTDLYAAAVAHAGISSIASYWGEGYWGYLYSSIATANSYPWNRKDIYVEQSPLFRADQNRVPILLTHGAADTNVPVGESDQFFIALKLLGKDVEYLQVAGQDHWILDHAKRIVWSRSIVAWFDKWLKGRPEWWDDLYPPLE